MTKILNSKIVLVFAVIIALTFTKSAYADDGHASISDVVIGVANAVSNVAAAQNVYNQQIAMNDYYLLQRQELNVAQMERLRQEQFREHLRDDQYHRDERHFDYYR